MRQLWRRPCMFILPLLSVLPGNAFAAGVGLRWDACVTDGGTINRSFACDTNLGALFLVSSFVVDQPVTSVRRVDVSLELASASATLPDWWDLNACRSGSRSAASVVPTACVLFPGTRGISGVVIGEHGPNTERIEMGSAASPAIVNVSPGQENIVVALRLNLLRTIGSGSCGGCDIPVCIVVRSVSFTQVQGQPPGIVLTQPLNGTDANYAAWQGGGSPVVGGSIGCPAATSIRRSVWGAVKALYR